MTETPEERVSGDGDLAVGPFVLTWLDIRKCFWLQRTNGEGMDMGKEELEAILAAYWRENF